MLHHKSLKMREKQILSGIFQLFLDYKLACDYAYLSRNYLMTGLGKNTHMMPISLPAPSSPERRRLIFADFIRTRALDRLYARKAAVEDLIRALEDYQRNHSSLGAECIEFSVPPTCS
jgi:hypothetical protein